MRSLQTKDVFAMVRLIDEVGIKEELKKLILSKDSIKDLTQESFGYDVIFLLVDGACKKNAEKALYEFFGGIFEMDPEKVGEMDPTEFIEKAISAAEPEKWKLFFTSVRGLMKSNSLT